MIQVDRVEVAEALGMVVVYLAVVQVVEDVVQGDQDLVHVFGDINKVFGDLIVLRLMPDLVTVTMLY